MLSSFTVSAARARAGSLVRVYSARDPWRPAAVSSSSLPSPSSCSLRSGFPPLDFCFQLSVFQLFASWPVEQRALGLLLARRDFD